ncbi:MAG: SPOR domain-containing protein [bacterium]|nr:SPOR domain-containing protein [bacterium]
MGNSEKSSYLEINVTFHHVVTLLVGVLLIGSFLFYLGYQAGKSSAKRSGKNSQQVQTEGDSKEIRLVNKQTADPDKIEEVGENEPAVNINEEIKLHRQPLKKSPPKKKKKDSVKIPAVAKKKDKKQDDKKRETKRIESKPPEIKVAKPVKRTVSFTIQLAAFESYDLAKNYSKKFSKAGYSTSVAQATVKGKVWFRVRVGQFKTRKEAKKERAKLEKMENKKFNIVKDN